ncbi:hypothetical protein [uncultured Adlercreutzia sp.]|uniref:hypothetical protein n=1 Tax=uncultured Adlercreutzia sp. TaxID=875803 RepID=UPI0026F3C3AB|nr:hypothetical protein [uncultured Adlercreutzia sp.]
MLKTFQNLTQRQRIALIVLAAAMVGCLAMMAVSPARSALTYFSPEYEAEIAQTHIGVALTENGEIRSGEGDLLREEDREYLLFNTATEKTDEYMQPGQEYREALSVKNISEDGARAGEDVADQGMPEYVRLTVRKYWAEGDEGAQRKSTALDPSLIELTFDETSATCWVRSDEECTDEREVYYYKTVLNPGESAAQPAITGITVSERIVNTVESYENCWLALDAQVDSVQVNNAEAAAVSAWGIDVTKFADQGLDWSGEE